MVEIYRCWTYVRPPIEESAPAAIRWELRPPAMCVTPAQPRPVLLIVAWNELGDGSYRVPTIGDLTHTVMTWRGR